MGSESRSDAIGIRRTRLAPFIRRLEENTPRPATHDGPVATRGVGVGWTHTVNMYDGFDVYSLTPAGDGYLFNGEQHAFETTTHRLKVKNEDGTPT